MVASVRRRRVARRGRARIPRPALASSSSSSAPDHESESSDASDVSLPPINPRPLPPSLPPSLPQARARDHRGYTQDLYRDDSYPEHVQPPEPGHRHVSLSHSHRGVLRGLLVTYRSRLVSVVKGAIYDVIVDCRPESRTYRRWCVAIVSSANRRQVFVPGGCAHGFLGAFYTNVFHPSPGFNT